MQKIFSLIAIGFLLGGCAEKSAAQPDSAAAPPADIVFLGGHIITMDPALPEVDAVAVRGDAIAAVGTRNEVEALVGEDTRVVELGDKALLPGFIDAHGHFAFTARLLDYVNLSSPPVGPVENIDDLIARLQAHIEDNEIAPGEWTIGYGYDDSLLAEKRHPTRDDLDLASEEHPILILHVSGHLAAANSRALAEGGITAGTDDPPGGVIRRREGSREPDGVLEETAASKLAFARLFATPPERLDALARKAITYYASFGVTTIQDGATAPAEIEFFRAAAAREPFAADIAAYPYVTNLSEEQFETLEADAEYESGYRVAGAKFSLDGSPQGRTAWLTEPYEEGPRGAAEDYVAYPTTEPDYYKPRAADLLARGVPFLVHANGDAAIDLAIEGVAEALEGRPVSDHRTVIIHAQLMREDQLDAAKRLGMVPSFYSAHPFFWGDWHRVSFGEERASNISPLRWAIERDVPYTIHNDTPVVPPNIMRLIWSTVNRKTRSGYVLGPEQRATVAEALWGVTLGAAYQYFEEDRKGSITPGKQADLIILGNDPHMVDPDLLKDIPVIETIARGQTIYRVPTPDERRRD
jgi:predicted amidohydrolase YtcJ